MTRNTPIAIIGFGSIGKRHYRNLKSLGYKNVVVYDVSKKALKDHDGPTLNAVTAKNLKDFEVAFICNPNNVHVSAAITAAKAGCHLFIEKPLSHSMHGIDQLEKLVKQKKLVTMIGCNMRFHPCLQFIKRYLESKKIGKIYSIRHEFGSYLPSWRPGQDYRQNFAAKKSMGGGIILDDIHEFDLLFWLNDFAKVKKSNFIYNRVSNLELETEDMAVAGFEFSNKVIGSVMCDYLQQSYTRTCKAIGAKGNLEWNFTDNQVWLKTMKDNKKLFEVKKFDFNKVYIDEVKYFFNHINKKQLTFNDVTHAKFVLKECLSR